MSLWDRIKNIMVISDEDDYEDELAEENERPVREKVSEEPAYSVKKEAPAKIIKSKSLNY